MTHLQLADLLQLPNEELLGLYRACIAALAIVAPESEHGAALAQLKHNIERVLHWRATCRCQPSP